MTKEYIEFRKTMKVDTLEQILEAFNHCGNMEDVENLEINLLADAPKILGEFYVDDYTEEGFTLTREFHNPETGDYDKETYEYKFAETPYYPFYMEITGTFRKMVKVYAKSDTEAEDKVEKAFSRGEIEFDGSESFFDANFYDRTEEYERNPEPEMNPPSNVIPL